jgi:hypothetical protein
VGDRILFRQRKGGTSVQSAHDPRLLIGVGDAIEAREITVRWPSGRVSTSRRLAADHAYDLNEPCVRHSLGPVICRSFRIRVGALGRMS